MARAARYEGKQIDRACELLKVVRSQWLTAGQAGVAVGYTNTHRARISLQILCAQGLVEEKREQVGIRGTWTRFYRVAQAWRNDA